MSSSLNQSLFSLFGKDKQPFVIHKLGKTCVGKGYIKKLLSKALRSTPHRIDFYSIGDTIKNRLEQDTVFRDKYLESVRQGVMVPDDAIFEIIKHDFSKMDPETKLLFFDGSLRTERQVDWATEHKILGPKNNAVFIFEASNMTCFERFGHRAKTQNRVDAEVQTLLNRCQMFEESIPGIKKKIQASKTPIFEIDANHSIPEEVFPETMSIVLRILFQITQPK